MGFLQNQSLDISEIVTETSTEPSPILLEEDEDIEVLQDQKEEIVSESKEKKFITSPADIEVHQKIELQDGNVSDQNNKMPLKNYVMNLKISFQWTQVTLEKLL